MGRIVATPQLVASQVNLMTLELYAAAAGASVLVAAADAPSFIKDVASYICNGVNDDVEIQAGIDQAQTYLQSNLWGVPPVQLSPGAFRLGSGISWKSAPMLGTKANVGTRIYWDGAPAATVLTKTADAGAGSFGLLAGIKFQNGTATPDTWLDMLTPGLVDSHFFVDDVQFDRATSDMIKVTAPVNCHWQRMRFDGPSTYAIRVVNDPTAFLGTFRLEDFTYDNAGVGGNGVLIVECGNNSNMGTVVLENGRIELNSAWTGPSGIFVASRPATTQSRSVAWALKNVTFQDVVPTNNAVVLNRVTSDTTGGESLTLDDFRQSGLANIFGGTFPSWHGQPPLLSNYGRLDWNHNNQGWAVISDSIAVRNRNDVNHDAISVRQMGDANDRFQVDHLGRVLMGDGTATPVQVLGERVIDARIDDAINSGDATTDGVIDAIRDAMVAHGLIAAA